MNLPSNSTTDVFVFSNTITATREIVNIIASGIPYLIDIQIGKDIGFWNVPLIKRVVNSQF